MENKLHKYGYVKPEITPKHFVLGSSRSLPRIVLQADMNWEKYLPKYEPQFSPNGWDTDGCTIWGTLNIIETLVKKVFGTDANYSERYFYNLIPVRPPGTDPLTVGEVARVGGLVDDAVLPMTETFQEFCTPTPMTQSFIDMALKWLAKYGFGYEIVFSGAKSEKQRVTLIKEALQFSPVGVSVTAWFQNADGIYVDEGQPNTHWCECYGFDDESQAWKIFDSYDQSNKLYAYSASIELAVRYALTGLSAPSSPGEVVKKNEYWFVTLIKNILNFFRPSTWQK